MNNVQNCLHNLENDLYPHDPDNSWGIAITITRNIPTDIFDISSTLQLKLVALLRYDELWDDQDGPVMPQIIINFVDRKWIVRLQSFDPYGEEKEDYCVTLELSKAVISMLLLRFVNRGIRVYDCMETTVL